MKAGPLPAQLVGEFLRYRALGAVQPRGGFPQLPVNGQCVQGADQRPIILGAAFQRGQRLAEFLQFPVFLWISPLLKLRQAKAGFQPADQRVAAFHVGVDRGERLVLHGGVDPQAELREHHGDGILVHAKDAVFGDVAFPLRIGAAVVELFAQSREIIHAFDEKVTAAARGVQAGEFPRFPLGIERQRGPRNPRRGISSPAPACRNFPLSAACRGPPEGQGGLPGFQSRSRGIFRRCCRGWRVDLRIVDLSPYALVREFLHDVFEEIVLDAQPGASRIGSGSNKAPS